MIAYLLLLLKIIGIIFAILLGLILLVTTLILFVPIRYRGKLVRDTEQFYMRGKISWLFSLFSVKIKYEAKEIVYRVSFLGIPLIRSDKPRKSKKKAPASKIDRSVKGEATSIVKSNFDEDVMTKPDTPIKDEETSKKEGFFAKIQNKIRKIRETIISFIDKIKKIQSKPKAIKELLLKSESKAALAYAFGELKKIILHICPKKLKGTIIYGSGDPCSTGQTLGVIGILYARFGELLSITPDFEEKRFDCDVYFRGRIRVITVFVSAVKLLTYKELKKLIKDLKNICL